MVREFVNETRSHIADTFCQLALNYGIMRYDKLAKRVTKGVSVPL